MMYFIFDGMKSSEYGVGISGSGTFDAPERDVEMVTVPGRNGDLVIDNGRFNNITVTYPAYIASKMPKKIGAFMADLAKGTGYRRLEDSYHPEEYRMGMFANGLSVKPTALNIGAQFDIEFNCKPQRFLKSGEFSVPMSATGTIYNPTQFNAKPLLRVYGTGSVLLNSQVIVISSANGYTDIDCELMEAYKGAANCNANVTMADNLFLLPGMNIITLSNVTGVDIIPRWWTI